MDRAADRRNHLLGNGETHAVALSRQRAEGLEDALVVLHRDPRAVVGDADLQG